MPRALVFLSFSALIAIVGTVYWAVGSSNSLKNDSTQEEEWINIHRAGRYVEVEHRPELNPSSWQAPSGSFVLYAWVRPREMPADGQEFFFVSKIDETFPNLNGFALGVRRMGDALAPLVHWHDVSGAGQRFLFPDVTLSPHIWNLVVLVYQGPGLLSVHTGKLEREQDTVLNLAGGYSVDELELPSSDAPLVIGALAHASFRGQIAALGILAGADLDRALSSSRATLFREIGRTIFKFPDGIRDTCILALKGATLQSCTVQHVVHMRGFPRRQLTSEQD
jgi:hypothetical protein